MKTMTLHKLVLVVCPILLLVCVVLVFCLTGVIPLGLRVSVEHSGLARVESTPLLDAILEGAPIEEIEAIVSKDTRLVETSVPDLGSPLIFAASHDRSDVVSLLLKCGVDIDTRESTKGAYEGVTVLHIAALTDKEELARVVLEAGIDITIRAPRFGTARQICETQGSKKVEELIRRFESDGQLAP